MESEIQETSKELELRTLLSEKQVERWRSRIWRMRRNQYILKAWSEINWDDIKLRNVLTGHHSGNFKLSHEYSLLMIKTSARLFDKLFWIKVFLRSVMLNLQVVQYKSRKYKLQDDAKRLKFAIENRKRLNGELHFSLKGLLDAILVLFALCLFRLSINITRIFSSPIELISNEMDLYPIREFNHSEAIRVFMVFDDVGFMYPPLIVLSVVILVFYIFCGEFTIPDEKSKHKVSSYIAKRTSIFFAFFALFVTVFSLWRA